MKGVNPSLFRPSEGLDFQGWPSTSLAVIPIRISGGSGSGDWLSNPGGDPKHSGASGVMILESYMKSFDNTFDLYTGYASALEVSHKATDNLDRTKKRTISWDMAKGKWTASDTGPYTFITGYKEPVCSSSPCDSYVTGLSYDKRSLEILINNTGWFDTREMYALLKITGSADDDTPSFEITKPITGVK